MDTSADPVRFDPFELDLSSSELRKGPTRLRVPYQSIEILKALLERPGELVTRDELRQRLWPSNTVVDFEHGLNAAIRRLREALGDSADSPRFVETLPKRGYRFIGEIDPTPTPARAAPDPAGEEANLSLPIAEVSTGPFKALAAANESRQRSERAWTWRLGLAGSALVIIGTAAWMSGRPQRPDSVRRQAQVQIVPITSYRGLELDPSLSPDGNQLAFAWEGESGDNLDIYVRSVDGGTPVQLTKHRGAERAPVWSPNGRRIAFLREVGGGRSAVVVVPALGGVERHLTEIAAIRFIDPSLASSSLAWVPGGDSVVFADEESPSSGSRIFMCSVEACERQQLTQPGATFGDIAPALSPTGSKLAFVRRGSGAQSGQVFVQNLAGARPVGEPRAVTSDQLASNVTWSHDGRSLIYASNKWSKSGLWRVALDGGEPEPILMNVRASRPSIDRDGKRLVFQLTTTDMNIWRARGPANDDARSESQALISSTLVDSSPQFSPDGSRITFISFRTGAPEVWIARSDGAEQTPLTTVDAPAVGSPRWSPTGDEIAFDTTRNGGYNISVVNVHDRRVRYITNDRSTNLRPSWSRDGKWIYFSSVRSGGRQLFKIRSSGGPAIPITRKGGLEAFESPDEKHLYYVRADEKPENVGIWQVPVNGGDEVRVVDQGGRGNFAVTKNGIVILDPLAKPAATISFYSFASRRLQRIGQLSDGSRMAPSKIAVSPDEKWILYVQYDQWGSDIQMIEGSW